MSSRPVRAKTLSGCQVIGTGAMLVITGSQAPGCNHPSQTFTGRPAIGRTTTTTISTTGMTVTGHPKSATTVASITAMVIPATATTVATGVTDISITTRPSTM